MFVLRRAESYIPFLLRIFSTPEPLKASGSEVQNPRRLAQIRGAITVFASLNENLQSRVLNHMETERIYASCSDVGQGLL